MDKLDNLDKFWTMSNALHSKSLHVPCSLRYMLMDSLLDNLNTARTYRQGVAFTQTTIYLGNPVILAKVAQLDKLSLK